MTCNNARMTATIPTADAFRVVSDYAGDDRLVCPSCDWESSSLTVFDLGSLRQLAEAHLADRHQPTSACEVCGQPVTSWEYDSFTRDMQLGSGLTVQPCGHQVSKVETVIPR